MTTLRTMPKRSEPPWFTENLERIYSDEIERLSREVLMYKRAMANTNAALGEQRKSAALVIEGLRKDRNRALLVAVVLLTVLLGLVAWIVGR